MSKEKQIEEMAEDIGKSDFCKHLPKELCNKRSCSQCTAEIIYEAGYRKQSGWISVEERLPYAGEDVLVFCDGLIRIDFIGSSGVWYEHAPKQVTHWMPLPEAPKGGAE